MNWSQTNLWAHTRKFVYSLTGRIPGARHSARRSRGTSNSEPRSVFHPWHEYEPVGSHRPRRGHSLAKPSERVTEWRRRVLLKKGARLHETMLPKAADVSMAILDEFGMVVAWYDRERSTASDEVIGKHLTQFYTPTDVASSIPAQHLSAAVIDGSNTRRGWRRHLDGRVFWGITVITPIATRRGRLQGYAHLTTETAPPWEGAPLNSIRSRVESESAPRFSSE